MRKNWLSGCRLAAGLRDRRQGKDSAGEKAAQPAALLTRRYLLFSGRVQFVGFRCRSLYLAEEYGITGWVRNREDGRVEMEAQGAAEKLALFKRGLYELPGVVIEACEEDEREPVCSEKNYRVRG